MNLKRSGHFRLDAPGNLLLAGEYAITEEGGMGLCLAPDLRASLNCRPLATADLPFRFRGIWPGGGQAWQAPQLAWTGPFLNGAEGLPPLLAAVFSHLALSDLAPLDGHEIEIDTSAFYDQDGRKLGFGSSAVACLLLCAASIQLQTRNWPNLRERRARWAALPQLAVDSHRRFQGGRGSGYDVLCSLTGGVSVFRGGAAPRIRPAPAHVSDSFRSFCLIKGTDPVRTGSSILAWQTWRDANPLAAQAYIGDCARRIRRLEHDPASHPFALLNQAREAGIALGSAIGIGAELPFPQSVTKHNLAAKAVGAGNETGIVIGPAETLSSCIKDCTIRHPSRRGLQGQIILAEGSGQAKLLLFGEHSALYGWPAVGIALPHPCTIRLLANPNKPALVASPKMPEPLDADPAIHDLICRMIGQACGAFGRKSLPSGQWEISNQVPRLGGYGSSAALSVAIIRLLASLTKQPLTDTVAWQLANWLDSLVHGQASGIDAGLAMSDGIQVFHPKDIPAQPDRAHPPKKLPAAVVIPELRLDRRPLSRPVAAPPLWLVHGAIPRSGSTKTLVGDIAERMRGQDPHTKQHLELLGQTSQSAIQALEQGVDARTLGSMADLAQSHLAALGLSTARLDQLLDTGRLAGATGGKLSGAGGGGAFFLVCENQSAAQAVGSALAKVACPTAIISLPN